MHTEWSSAVPASAGPQDRRSDAFEIRPRVDGQPRRALELGTVQAIASERITRSAGLRGFVARHLKLMIFLGDIAAVVMGLAVATVLYGRLIGDEGESMIRLAVLSIPVWPLCFAHQGLYQSRRIGRRMEELRLIANATAASAILVAGLSVLADEPLPRTWIALVFFAVACCTIVDREFMRRLIEHLRVDGFITRRVVLVGRNTEAGEIAAMLRTAPALGYQVVGFVAESSSDEDESAGADLGPYLGGPERVVELVRSTGASGVVVATTGINQQRANRLVRDLTREGLYVEMTSGMRDIATSRMTVRALGGYPMVAVEPVADWSWRMVAKRGFDIVLASMILALVSPILLGAALAVRLTSGPHVFFKQLRVGRGGTMFTVYKLRTMVADAEKQLDELREHNQAAGPMFKMANDPRVTSVGRFLRATSIDELPQLFNVVKGDMSLVGPRPALPNEADQWDDHLRERLRVRPGITGMWQVSGRFTTSLETYARLDLYYVDNWSLVTDLAIMLKTIPAVLRRDGAA